MKWVWQNKKWPDYEFNPSLFRKVEEKFLLLSGQLKGVINSLESTNNQGSFISILLEEAVHSSKIEGEILDRDSVQSSIRKQLGFKAEERRTEPQEYGMAEMMVHLYLNFGKPLKDEDLFLWHEMIMNGRRDLQTIGAYRNLFEPIQIVSGSLHGPKVFYEAPASAHLPELMSDFVEWFNQNCEETTLPLTVFASLAHLYFEQLHPFEDGNGRIGRALCEKAISMRLGFPGLVSLSKRIETDKKQYYDALQKNNHSLNVNKWLSYHIELLLSAQEYSLSLVNFTLKKTKLFNLKGHLLNERQTKVLLKLFDAGPEGFKGGLSASNYQSITKAPSATSTRDLADLVEKQILRKQGVLKGTRYYLIQ